MCGDQNKAGHDGETCGGCRWWEERTTEHGYCAVEKQTGWARSDDACEAFKPSLQCRQVRAEERANQLRGEANELAREANKQRERIVAAMESMAPWYELNTSGNG